MPDACTIGCGLDDDGGGVSDTKVNDLPLRYGDGGGGCCCACNDTNHWPVSLYIKERAS